MLLKTSEAAARPMRTGRRTPLRAPGGGTERAEARSVVLRGFVGAE